MRTIRRVTEGDTAVLARMSCEFLSEVKILDNAPLDFDILLDTLALIACDPEWVGFIAYVDEEAAGFMAGRRISLFFSRKNIACDVLFYVREKHRGGLLVKRLMNSFAEWAFQDENCIGTQLNAFAGEDNERSAKLAEVLGFPRVGYITYRKRI